MKKYAGAYNFFTSHTIYLLCGFTIIFSAGSCEKHFANYNDERAQLEKAIDTATEIAHIYDVESGRKALCYIDGVYNKSNGKNIRDLLNYHKFRFMIASRNYKNAEESFAQADSMLQLITKNQLENSMRSFYVEALFSMGDALFMKRDYSRAFDFYYLAKKQGETHFTNCELGEFSYRIGMVLYKQQRYAEAAGYYKQCFAQEANCKNDFTSFYRRQEVLNNAGLSYDQANMPDSALASFKQALGFIYLHTEDFPDKKKEFFEMATAVVYGNVANIYLKKGAYYIADSLLKKSIAINIRDGNDRQDAEFSYLKLIRLNLLTDNIDKACQYLTTTRALLDSIPNNTADLEWNRQMASYYELTRKPDSALFYLKTFVSMNALARNELTILGKNNFIERVKILENQYQIELLKKQNNSKAIILFIAILIVLMAIFIGILVYQNWKKSKRYIQALTKLNNKIREQRNELQQALRSLENTNKDKDRIMRIVAHDIRNPVASISMLTNILLDDNPGNEQIEPLHLIRIACENALTLSGEILDVSDKMKYKNLKLDKTDIKSLLQNQVDLLRFSANEKKQTLILSLPEQPVYAMIHSEKIRRTINNLVTNAIKFSYPGVEIEIGLKEMKNELRIHVRDYGIGIPKEIKDKVFDSFTEAKRFGTEGEKPFGLGLSICKQIIEAHGGSIWLESDAKKGTTFYFSLPTKKVKVAAEIS